MIRIITDSAADFEPWELAKLNITCIPLSVFFGDAEYQENVNLSKDQFYALLESSGTLPKTAQPSPQPLLDIFEEAKAAGDDAIYITLSSALSGTYQNALVTQQAADSDRCHVIDSKNATGGQRLLVEYAVKLRDEGKTAAEIMAGVESIRDRIVLYACIDTLEYLYWGGRISHTVYKLGTMAQVKPIIQVDQAGAIEVPAKAIGMRKGMDYLCKRLEQQGQDENYPLYIVYTHNRANAEALAKRLGTLGYDIPESRIINVGAAIGSHIGVNACGIVFVSK